MSVQVYDHRPIIISPSLELKTCPQCGAEIEMFSTDMQRDCPKCGQTVYNDLESCIQWCPYARECVGEETYERLRGGTEG